MLSSCPFILAMLVFVHTSGATPLSSAAFSAGSPNASHPIGSVTSSPLSLRYRATTSAIVYTRRCPRCSVPEGYGNMGSTNLVGPPRPPLLLRFASSSSFCFAHRARHFSSSAGRSRDAYPRRRPGVGRRVPAGSGSLLGVGAVVVVVVRARVAAARRAAPQGCPWRSCMVSRIFPHGTMSLSALRDSERRANSCVCWCDVGDAGGNNPGMSSVSLRRGAWATRSKKKKKKVAYPRVRTNN